jgi:hypothetical protein
MLHEVRLRGYCPVKCLKSQSENRETEVLLSRNRRLDAGKKTTEIETSTAVRPFIESPLRSN